MEHLFHAAQKSHARSEAHVNSPVSAALAPWSDKDKNGAAHEVRLRETANGRVRPPYRKLDNSRIADEVIMAQRLSREEEKNLHFIIQRYRLLCNRLVEVARNLGSQVFLITSALAEEGKSLTTSNLAFALSTLEDKRTLLVDLDLRRYTLHGLLGLRHDADEKHFLLADDWHDSVWSLRPGLDALLSANAVDHPDEMLHSQAMRTLLDEARHEYDYILLDSAPLLLAADTHALIPIIDQALLIVRADHTPIACSQDALKILGDKAVGCILNDVKRLKYEAYYHGYYGTD